MPTVRDEKYVEAKILYASTTTAIGRYQLQPLIYKDAGDLVGFLLFPSDLSPSTLDLGIQSFALHPVLYIFYRLIHPFPHCRPNSEHHGQSIRRKRACF